jgi:hypothetical protein
MWSTQASLHAEVLVSAEQRHKLTLIGPVAADTRGPGP